MPNRSSGAVAPIHPGKTLTEANRNTTTSASVTGHRTTALGRCSPIGSG
jgi:hypothetical protein